jgi:hypothetical protein
MDRIAILFTNKWIFTKCYGLLKNWNLRMSLNQDRCAIIVPKRTVETIEFNLKVEHMYVAREIDEFQARKMLFELETIACERNGTKLDPASSHPSFFSDAGINYTSTHKFGDPRHLLGGPESIVASY